MADAGLEVISRSDQVSSIEIKYRNQVSKSKIKYQKVQEIKCSNALEPNEGPINDLSV
jgi:hypothetical protein